MSYRIEYRWLAFAVDGTGADTAEPRFVVAVEGGDSNVTTRMWTGQRLVKRCARRWEVCMLGTARQVLRQAVEFAGACERGCLKPLGRDCSPEAYIGRIRRLVARAGPTPCGIGWAPDVRIAPGHPALAYAESLGLVLREEVRFGCRAVHVDLQEAHRHRVFDLVDRFPGPRGWQLATTVGLAS